MNNFTTTTRKYFSLVLAAGALLLGLNVGTVYAGDDAKLYPGTMCRPSLGLNNYAPHVHYNGDGSISNTSEGFSVTVDCPIVRDNTTNKDGLKSVVLYYDDQNPYENLKCRVYSRWIWGNTIHQSKSSKTIKNLGISYAYVHGLDSSRGPNTFYTMSCVIPRKVAGRNKFRLLNYKVTEGDSTWGN